MKKLTKEQGIILTGFTGKLCCNFSDFHEDVEKKLRRPVFTHELADQELWEKIKEMYREEFMKIVPKGETKGKI